MMKDEQHQLNTMSYGEIIRYYRLLRKMSKTELASRLETTRNTIANWENDKNTPDIKVARKLCTQLDIPYHILLGSNEMPMLSVKEIGMIAQYRRLSEDNQRLAERLIAVMAEEEAEAYSQALKKNYCILPKESTPSAAGIGYPDMGNPSEPVFVMRNRFSERADTLVTVSGDSMEPKYFDGDLLYVKFTFCCEDGDDVVCVYHEGFILKHYYDHRLFSLNADRPFGDQHEYDDIKIIGKVIGVVDEKRDLPNKKDREQLEMIYSEELKRFYKA